MQLDNKIEELQSLISKKKDELSSLKGQSALLDNQIEGLQSKISEGESNVLKYEKEVEILKIVQIASQNIIKEAFESPGSHALEFIFGKGYELHLEFKSRGKTQEVRPFIKTPNKFEPLNPIDSDSGGVIDIANLILRSMILEVIRPKFTAPLLLDEPFKHVRGKTLVNRTEDYLAQLQSKTGRQIILSSEHSEFQDEKYNIIQVGELSNGRK